MGKIRDILTTAAATAAVTASTLAVPSAPGVIALERTPRAIKFDPSQQRLMDDESRVIVVVWHRQKGKDFTAAAKAIRHALRTRQTWFIVSLTQRQADATFEKCKRVAKLLMTLLAIAGEPEEGPSVESQQYDAELKQSFVFLAREIRLPGGGRVVSLPGRDPDTLAGLTGNVIFTEFGLFPNGGYAHWRVVFPLTTRGFTCIVISTPRGKNTKFYELFANVDGAYSVHFCDIARSIADDGFVLRDNEGNPTSIEAFKKLYGDAAGFEREYECKFTGDASSLIKWAALERAAALGVGMPFTYRRFDDVIGGTFNFETVFGFSERQLRDPAFHRPGARYAIGWDVARHNDLSSVWINSLVGREPSSLRYLILMRGISFGQQRGVLELALRNLPHAVGFGDATGLGMQVNEELQEKFRSRWTSFTFTGPGKREIGSALRTAFDDGTQAIPPMAGAFKFVATDLYAVQQDDTGARLVISEAPNPMLDESHCDIAYSCGLARRAESENAIEPLPVGPKRRPIGM